MTFDDYLQHGPQQTFELASGGSRLLAFIIDAIVRFIPSLILLAIFSDSLVVGLLFDVIYKWFFWINYDGQTPGKMAMNIRIIRTDGASMTHHEVLLRILGEFVSAFILLLGFLWIIFDANNQGWHDKIAGTYVVVTAKKQVVI